jgi:putative ABC transport system permease protein
MRALDRKLFRDLARMRTQAVAIALVVAAGMAMFVALVATYGSLQLSEARYYEEQRLADVWVRLARAPQAVLRDIAAIPGVAAVAGRLVSDAVLDIPGIAEPVTAVVFSVPAKNGHALNDVYVRRGRHVEAGHPGEVLVSEAFSQKNHLVPGDSILATIAGQRVALQIVGVALSPEQVMVTPPGGLAPDDRRFGVLWMEEAALARLLRLPDSINDVAVRLAAPESEAAVIASLDSLLQPYGGLGAYGRTNQPSYVDLEAHIVALRGLTVIVPAIFLIVAAFLTHLVVSRLVSIQRQQIGMLKAFGYSNARVAAHFAELPAAIALLGVAGGIPVGVWLGRLITMFFVSFFRFPATVFQIEPAFIAVGAAVALIGSLSGAVSALRGVATLPPAVAMSPAAPVYRPSTIVRPALMAWFAPVTRMIVRNVTRWPVRASLTTAGMSFAVALLILGETMAGGIARLIEVQFGRSQREDISVVLLRPQSLEHQHDFEELPGVRRAEPYRVVPARIRIGAIAQDVALRGLPPDGVLRQIVAADFEDLPIPPDGAILGSWVAARLGIHRGDVVPIELRERRRRTIPVHIVGLIDEAAGTSVYMNLGVLGRLIEEPETFSAVNLLVDPVRQSDLYRELKRAPRVKGVDLRRESVASLKSTFDSTVSFIQEIVAVFAVIIAFGMVYNVARIALAERGYELATLRVLGFTRREISGVLLGEIGILALLAVPIGFGIGTLLAARVVAGIQSERMRLPMVIEPSSYAWAFLIFTAAVLASALLVRRRLDYLDLVEVLKARD